MLPWRMCHFLLGCEILLRILASLPRYSFASVDGNPDTADKLTGILSSSPALSRISSGHATVTGAAMGAHDLFWGTMPVQGWSEAFGESTVRSFANFTAAADEAIGTHLGRHAFPFSVHDARAAGDAIGTYVMANAPRSCTITEGRGS